MLETIIMLAITGLLIIGFIVLVFLAGVFWLTEHYDRGARKAMSPQEPQHLHKIVTKPEDSE